MTRKETLLARKYELQNTLRILRREDPRKDTDILPGVMTRRWSDFLRGLKMSIAG